MDNAIQKTRRIALFGGSFDPIHCAHLEVARCALKQAQLDHVVFIPAAQSPLKHEPLSASALRVEMLRLALQAEEGFKLDTYEIEKGGVNYTIDTVDYFQKHYENTELFWIVGSDQFPQLDKWYRISELANRLTFLVCPRTGYSGKVKVNINSLRYKMLEAVPLPQSSTEIRERCKKKLSLSGLVPKTVEAFIYKRNLYST